MGKDIHNMARVLDKKTEPYISKLFPEDQEDVRRFINDLLAKAYSAGRIVKYLYAFESIRKRLDKPFKVANSDDIKRYVAQLEKTEYTEWSKHQVMKE